MYDGGLLSLKKEMHLGMSLEREKNCVSAQRCATSPAEVNKSQERKRVLILWIRALRQDV